MFADCVKWHNAYRTDGLGANALPEMKADSKVKDVMKKVADRLKKNNCATVGHSNEAQDAKVRSPRFLLDALLADQCQSGLA